MTNKTETLLPCPAGHNSSRVIGGPGTAGGPKYWAGCDHCSWRAWGDTEAEAIAAWNHRIDAQRAHAPDVRDLVERATRYRNDNFSLSAGPVGYQLLTDLIAALAKLDAPQSVVGDDDDLMAVYLAGLKRGEEEALRKPATATGLVDITELREMARNNPDALALTNGDVLDIVEAALRSRTDDEAVGLREHIIAARNFLAVNAPEHADRQLKEALTRHSAAPEGHAGEGK